MNQFRKHSPLSPSVGASHLRSTSLGPEDPLGNYLGEESEGFEDEDDEFGENSAAPGKPRTLTRREVIDLLGTSRDFSGLDLRKANLTKLDFAGCSFSGCNLSYVNFRECNLEGCNFSNASMWNANLEGANLTRCNLEDADLDYTKLRGAVLYRAIIRRTTLPTDLIPREEIMKSVNEGTKISR